MFFSQHVFFHKHKYKIEKYSNKHRYVIWMVIWAVSGYVILMFFDISLTFFSKFVWFFFDIFSIQFFFDFFTLWIIIVWKKSHEKKTLKKNKCLKQCFKRDLNQGCFFSASPGVWYMAVEVRHWIIMQRQIRMPCHSCVVNVILISSNMEQ